jgi:hypothetical protein
MSLYNPITTYIKYLYPSRDLVLLHCPEFLGNEKKYLAECIDTKYVSYVGHFVADMECKICEITEVKHTVAMVNGTAAIYILPRAVDIKPGADGLRRWAFIRRMCAKISHESVLDLPIHQSYINARSILHWRSQLIRNLSCVTDMKKSLFHSSRERVSLIKGVTSFCTCSKSSEEKRLSRS